MFSIRGPNAMHVDASSRGATLNLVAACRLPRAQERMPRAKKAKKAKKSGKQNTNAPIATAATSADIMWPQSTPAADMWAALNGARRAVANVTSSGAFLAAAAETTTAGAVTTEDASAKNVAAGGVAAKPVTLNIAAAATAATVAQPFAAEDDAAADAAPAAHPPAADPVAASNPEPPTALSVANASCNEPMLAAARPPSLAPLASIDTPLQHVPSESSPAAPPADSQPPLLQSCELRAPQPLRKSTPKIQADVPAWLPGSVPDDTVPNDGGGGGEGSFGEGAAGGGDERGEGDGGGGRRISRHPPAKEGMVRTLAGLEKSMSTNVIVLGGALHGLTCAHTLLSRTRAPLSRDSHIASCTGLASHHACFTRPQ